MNNQFILLWSPRYLVLSTILTKISRAEGDRTAYCIVQQAGRLKQRRRQGCFLMFSLASSLTSATTLHLLIYTRTTLRMRFKVCLLLSSLPPWISLCLPHSTH
jgi:hypothetical protein